MACFLAPIAAVIVVNAVSQKVPSAYHVGWLLAMLWGGVVMLVVEHILSGELVFYPPFLTASPAQFLPEIWQRGVPMTLAIFIVWLAAVWGQRIFARRRTRKFVGLSAEQS